MVGDGCNGDAFATQINDPAGITRIAEPANAVIEASADGEVGRRRESGDVHVAKNADGDRVPAIVRPAAQVRRPRDGWVGGVDARDEGVEVSTDRLVEPVHDREVERARSARHPHGAVAAVVRVLPNASRGRARRALVSLVDPFGRLIVGTAARLGLPLLTKDWLLSENRRVRTCW